MVWCAPLHLRLYRLLGGLVRALAPTLFLGTALSLFEERREDAAQRDQQRDNEHAKAHGAPERCISGRAGLLRDVGVGDAAGDESEDEQGGGEDVKIASHGLRLGYVRRLRMSVARKSGRSAVAKDRVGFDQASVTKTKRRLLRDAAKPNDDRDRAFQKMILSIPPGKVSTYGHVAAAAGYPLYHRAVARLLRTELLDQLPWHRVVGAGGEIKLPGMAAREQRARLKLEGVGFRGNRVDMERFEAQLRPWEVWE